MIEVSANIDAYFGEIVRDAMKARAVPATPTAEHYLVALLAEHARGTTPTEGRDRPLTFQLRDALEQRGADRFERLRSIGDHVLYILGFFGSGIRRRGADPEYVMSVGSSAYGHASAMMQMCGTGESGHDVLDELAKGFDSFVGVMTDVADAAHGASGDDTSILRLYERWQETKSPRIAATLNELGVFPVQGRKVLH